MKLGTRKQILFVKLLALFLALYVPYTLWTHRDITWQWRDEVQLNNGSRIWVKRTEVREVVSGGEPFRGPSRGTKISRIEFPDEPGSVVWEAKLEAMIVERGTSPVQWIVIASPIWCEEYWKYGSPHPPYIQFEFANGVWTHRPVESSWYGRHSNLLMPEEQRGSHNGQLVSAEKIKNINNPVNKIFEQLLTVTQKAKFDCSRY